MEQALKEGLTTILKIAKNNPILIEARNDKLFVGTHTEYHKVIYETTIKQRDSFRAVLSSEIAKEIPDMIVGDVEVDENSISFNNNANKTKIALIEDKINLTSLARGYEKEENAAFATNELRDAFMYVKHASNDKTIGDLVMRGFHFTVGPSACEVMASNGAILSLVKIHQTNPDFNKSQVLLLNPDFFSAIKILEGEFTNVGFNENAISLTASTENHTIRIISSLVNGKNLPYESVVDNAQKNIQVKYVVDKRSFLEAVKQVKVFSEKSADLKIFNTGEVEIESNASSGFANREIKVVNYENMENNNFTIRVNIEMLFSYLSSNREELISIGVNSNESPIIFQDNFGLDILAPLRQA